MANWPSTLPKPALSGYSLEPQNAVLKTQMEAGPNRYRKRYTSVPMDVKASLLLTAEQMSAFKTFYQTTINQGADWFVFDGLNLGNGYATGSEVHFTEPYKANYIGRGQWDINFSLEVRNA
jgi:hypothetical protein